LRRTDEVCCQHGISPATFSQWKGKYGGLEVFEAKSLKALEDENAWLKKLLAEIMLDKAVLRTSREKVVTPAASRAAVAHVRAAFRFSKRRACRIVGWAQDGALPIETLRLRAAPGPAAQVGCRAAPVRFGYRRLA
jgi:hypothetical protein